MSLLKGLIQPVSQLLDKVIPDQDLKRKLTHEIATMAEKQAHAIAMAQIKVNEADAKGNWFQSSWRPLTAYVCLSGFVINYLVSPLAAPFGVVIPQVDVSMMLPILTGMLGLAGLRSYERVKKVGKD
tara:strand:+ start:4466 stop:4846 length:381 start_codon:yes stop_codon:yes gene_type:complete